MILLYTGAGTSNTPQINAEKSLGGFVSSTPVPNGRLNNIFSDLSKSGILDQRKEIRLIALKNTTGAIVNGVTVYTNKGTSSSILSIAAVASAVDSCSNIVFEKVQDAQTLPYQATLALHEGSGAALSVGTMQINQVIGIWIYRDIDLTKFPQLVKQDTPLTCSALATILENQETETGEEVQLLINWT